MQMDLKFTVSNDDTEVDVAVKSGAADMIELEDEFDIGAGDLATKQRAKYLVFLGWSALNRRGRLGRLAEDLGLPAGALDTFDAFRKRVESFEVEGAEDADGDTPPALKAAEDQAAHLLATGDQAAAGEG